MMRTTSTARTSALDEESVISAYRRWAPVYDQTFGFIAAEGRKHAVEIINQRPGRVLEVGVGTGLSLPMYDRRNEIVGIDLSPDMLDKARERVRQNRLGNVAGLLELDASDLPFEDASFDTVVAMYVLTVVPNPEQVMLELARVTRPGGEVMLVNHFSQEEGVRGWIERRMSPFADRLGWRPVFDLSRVLGAPQLVLKDRRQLRPMGLFTLLRFEKPEHHPTAPNRLRGAAIG